MMGNMHISENTLVSEAADSLARLLPAAWSVNMRSEPLVAPRQRADVVLEITAPDGRSTRLIVEAKGVLHPAGVRQAVDLQRALGATGTLIVLAPWMSAATQAELDAAGIHRYDLTGNVRLALSEPGLFVLRTGALHDPAPSRGVVSLRGTRASAVVRRLASTRPPIGVRDLARSSAATPGYVARLLDTLEEAGAVTRTPTGQVGTTDLRRMLERWAQDAPLAARAQVTSWIEPRGLSALLARLGKLDVRYAITGSFAALRRAPVAAPRVISLYVERATTFAEALQLRPADAGANVQLHVPADPSLLDEVWLEDGLRYAPLPTVAADLISGPGRNPAEGEALLTWMLDHAEVWRG